MARWERPSTPIRTKGSLGSLHATDAPPGSFAISGHDAPHAHMIHPDPQNKFVLQTDLGQDRIYIYKFNADSGKLTAADTPFITFPSGDGPRHFAFHPNGRWLYSIQEEASTIEFFHYDSSTGALTQQQTVSTLPAGYPAPISLRRLWSRQMDDFYMPPTGFIIRLRYFPSHGTEGWSTLAKP